MQAAQGGVCAGEDVLVAEIVALRSAGGIIAPTDAALGLNDDLLAQVGVPIQGTAKDFFGAALGIDVGVIKEVDAQLEGAVEELRRLLFEFFGNGSTLLPPAAEAHAAGAKT